METIGAFAITLDYSQLSKLFLLKQLWPQRLRSEVNLLMIMMFIVGLVNNVKAGITDRIYELALIFLI